MGRAGFILFLIFLASWFLRLTARFPALGTIRLDLVLVALIFSIFLLFTDKQQIRGLDNPCYKRMVLFIYVILAITPFAEWPGSVIRFGLPNFVKAIVFFFFTVWFVQTEARLKAIVVAFVCLQSFRVLEPLYLHLTEGYWGSAAFMSNHQFMNRLAGAPYDIINPNGLAFVILTIFPFFLLFFKENIYWKIAASVMVPTSLYALYLTGSRSGVLGLITILFVFFVQSKRKMVVLISIFVLSISAVTKIEGNFKDRYMSIFSSETANAGTAQGRIDGMWNDFRTGLRKPITGHGLGTSAETNANFGNGSKIAHNIYAETFQEIGIIGLGLFLSLIYLIFKNLALTKSTNEFIMRMKSVLLIFASMNAFFGMASYGLSSYEWYFLAALSVIVFRKEKDKEYEEENSFGSALACGGNTHLPSVCTS